MGFVMPLLTALRALVVPVLVLAALASAGPAFANTASDLAVSNPTFSGDTIVGNTVTYAVDVTNNGPDAAEANFFEYVGEAEQLISISSSQGSCVQDQPVSCSLGELAAGARVSISITVKFVRAQQNQNSVSVTGNGSNNDPARDNDMGGVAFTVTEPGAGEQPEVSTPTATTGEWSRAQASLAVDAQVAPYGAGSYYFEYGRTKSYGSKTAAKKVSGDQLVTVKATLRGLAMSTTYHYRVVLVVNGKTYRGRDRSAKTLGKLLYGPLTLTAVKRWPTSTSYKGLLGDHLADAPGACKGTVIVQVYTLQGADLLLKKTKMRSDCTYSVTVPFGAKQRAKYGRKGSVLIQARFMGSRAVAMVGSDSDRP